MGRLDPILIDDAAWLAVDLELVARCIAKRRMKKWRRSCVRPLAGLRHSGASFQTSNPPCYALEAMPKQAPAQGLLLAARAGNAEAVKRELAAGAPEELKELRDASGAGGESNK